MSAIFRVAHASRVLAMAFSPTRTFFCRWQAHCAFRPQQKIASARRQNQVAAATAT